MLQGRKCFPNKWNPSVSKAHFLPIARMECELLILVPIVASRSHFSRSNEGVCVSVCVIVGFQWTVNAQKTTYCPANVLNRTRMCADASKLFKMWMNHDAFWESELKIRLLLKNLVQKNLKKNSSLLLPKYGALLPPGGEKEKYAPRFKTTWQCWQNIALIYAFKCDTSQKHYNTALSCTVVILYHTRLSSFFFVPDQNKTKKSFRCQWTKPYFI